MYSTLVEGFPHSWQIDAIKGCDLKPVYWVTHRLKSTRLIAEDVIFHDSEDAIKGVRPTAEGDYRESYLPNAFYEDHVALMDALLRMLYFREQSYRRYDRAIYASHSSTRRYLYREIAYWNHVLDKYSIELVLLEAMPHLHYHYILYYLAKVKHIMVLFSHRGTMNLVVEHALDISMEVRHCLKKHQLDAILVQNVVPVGDLPIEIPTRAAV